MTPTDKQRRETERRRLQRQAERRREQHARHRRFALIGSVVGALVLVGVVVTIIVATTGSSSSPAASSQSPSATTASSAAASPSASASATEAAASYPCTWTTTSDDSTKKATKPSTTTPPKTGTASVSVVTNRGPMTFTLNRSGDPCTVASFLSLVQQKFYDATSCHRLVTSGIYVLQCGDPSGTGSGGPGYSIPDEATGNETYPAGTIAMARTTAAHSGGSQFFIVYKDSPNLQQKLGKLQYTVFGKVTSGLAVVTKVAAGGSDNSNGSGDGKPKLPLSFTSMTLAKA